MRKLSEEFEVSESRRCSLQNLCRSKTNCM